MYSGWAIDPDVSGSIDVHAYVDGVGTNLGATSIDRPDLGGPFPGYGIRHGFASGGAGLGPGAHQVCVAGINVGGGGNSLMACRNFSVPSGSPTGVVEFSGAASGRRVRVSGWTLDPDTAGPTDVHVYVDGAGANTGAASGNRPDIGAAFPAYGSAHGFSWTSSTLAPGAHTVCVFAINAGGGENRLLDCRTVTL